MRRPSRLRIAGAGEDATQPEITVGVATFNRAALWKEKLLSRSLLDQTDRDFELLIVDDGSTDLTVSELLRLRDAGELPDSTRIFSSHWPDKRAVMASAMVQNVIIREAKGEAIVFLDDDGWVEPTLVAYLKYLRCAREFGLGVYYGDVLFHDPKTKKLLYRDIRWTQRNEWPDAIFPVKPWECWGPIFLAPTHVLREIGGHDAVVHSYRGSDARLGSRLYQAIPSYFVARKEMRFHHLGPSWFQKKFAEGKKREIRENHKFEHARQLTDELVKNGGIEYWADKRFSDYVHEL